MDVAQLVAQWIPGPILALVILAFARREMSRFEASIEKFERMTGDLAKGLAELQIMSREFITVRSHGESISRIYEEIRKADDSLRERVLRLEIHAEENKT